MTVTFPAPPDGDPAFWTPDAETVAAYQGADLILLNGAGYAKWVDKVSLPKSKLANTSEAFRDQYIAFEGAATHTHGPGGDHAHGETAFTTWLDAKLAVKQADAVRAALTKLRPEQEATFAENFAALKNDLNELDELLAKHPAKWMIWDGRPAEETVAKLAEAGLESAVFDPCGNTPEQGDYLSVQQANLDNLARVFAPSP